MSNLSTIDPRQVFLAALTLFGRHGFQRTSMADIAREARISRAALYLRFSDKRALFEGLAASLVDEALAAAKAAWTADAATADAIEAIVLAKELGFFRIINTPHGAEIVDIHAEFTVRHVQRLDAGYIEILTDFGEAVERQGASLTTFGGARGFAHFLAATGAGLKHVVSTEQAYREAISRLASVTSRAAQSDGPT